MYRLTLLLVGFLTIHLSYGQNEVPSCPENSVHACANSTHFRDCAPARRNDTTLYPCDLIISGDNLVCYNVISKDKESVCGPKPADCAAAGFFRIPGKCKVYTSCSATATTPPTFSQSVLECPSGQEFSPAERRCVLTASAGCSITNNGTNSNGTGGTTTPRPGTNSPCQALTQRIDDTSCRRYHQCFFGLFELRLRCLPGWFFDAKSLRCRAGFLGNQVDCGSRPRTTPEDIRDKLVAPGEKIQTADI